MKGIKMILAGFIFSLFLAGSGRVAARGNAQSEDGSLLIRLQAATFDPLAGVPKLPANLSLDAYPQGSTGPYIVQFGGPVQESWKEQLAAAGGTVLGYIPDDAYLVWMDEPARLNVSSLDAVRWLGLYQPAYKISPAVQEGKPDMVKVSLFPGSDLDAVQARLASINTPTVEVPGEVFVLVLPEGNASAVAAWPEVEWIEPFRIPEIQNNIATGIMNAPAAWSAGLTGSGMMVTVADTGIDSGVDTAAAGDMHPDFDNRLSIISSWPVQAYGSSGCWNVGADDGAGDVASGHGTHVLGSVAGNGAASGGQIKGLAYQANLTLQAVEQFIDFTPFCEAPPYNQTDGFYLMGLPDNLNALFLEAYNWGSRIHSNSWGDATDPGVYTIDAANVDAFIWNHPDMSILFAAGNAGVDQDANGYVDEDSINSPGTSKNAITSGASENTRASGGLSLFSWSSFGFSVLPTSTDLTSNSSQHLAAFSSRGPTDDGRIKPDLVAPGTSILSTKSSLSSSSGWGAYNTRYMYNGGTSMATPLIAGAATLVREYYVEKRGFSTPSAALIKATLINTAVDLTGYGNSAQEAGQPIPNNHEGWGLVNVGAASAGNRFFVDGVTVTPGVTRTYTFPVKSSASPIKFSLVWSDYPAAASAANTLVNNLDLVVTAPDGSTVYRGNRFSGGWSVTGGTADTVNNVENVYIQNPASGTWTVQVVGTNVPQGPQPFALVGPEVVSNKVYIPLVLKGGSASPSSPALCNGDFESGRTCWSENSSLGYELIMNQSLIIPPHGGAWVAWLGGDNGETSILQQQVTVPPASPYLAYWYWTLSYDFCGWDFGRIRINNTQMDSLNLCSDNNTGTWVQRVVNLSAYSGQSVTLQIKVETDLLDVSHWFIDDVTFQASPTPSPSDGGRYQNVDPPRQKPGRSKK